MEKNSGLPALKKTRSVGQRSKEEMFQVVKGVVENHQEGAGPFVVKGMGFQSKKHGATRWAATTLCQTNSKCTPESAWLEYDAASFWECKKCSGANC